MTAFLVRICLIGLMITLSGAGAPDFMLIEQAGAAEAKKSDDDLTKAIYIKVPPLSVTMYHRGRPKGSMTVTLLIKLADNKKRATAYKYLPRLSSAFVIEASRLSHDFFDINRPVDVAMLGDAFQQVTNRLLGHREARVLLSDVTVYKR